MANIELGDRVMEMVGGFTGIVTGYTKHLSGCDRVNIQGPVGKDGKIGECYSFDVLVCEVLQKGAVKIESPTANTLGGPHSRPPAAR